MIGENPMKNHYLRKKIIIGIWNMEDITEVHYVHTKKVCQDLETKNLGDYHDSYVQSDS